MYARSNAIFNGLSPVMQALVLLVEGCIHNWKSGHAAKHVFPILIRETLMLPDVIGAPGLRACPFKAV
ncbi:hypothetical protein GCM10007868_12610 [Gluconobacter frateurii]|uniref:Transposase n=1 Tax=Gluconobacter frateurii NRIC 0228 TaxID=1307946 RepID=A0ABQ0QDX6_9PROT|nr:hypothetical protein AA0228_2389 [Gluconobacter frateurii NRIC 0228]GLP90186.1 hypothetical protein GCM10007868_12610 [Gluconobacter frateurii]